MGDFKDILRKRLKGTTEHQPQIQYNSYENVHLFCGSGPTDYTEIAATLNLYRAAIKKKGAVNKFEVNNFYAHV